MLQYKLYHSKFRATNSQNDLFTVEVEEIKDDFMLTLSLVPLDADLEGETITVDLLNETIPQYLEDNGYKVILQNIAGGE